MVELRVDIVAVVAQSHFLHETIVYSGVALTTAVLLKNLTAKSAVVFAEGPSKGSVAIGAHGCLVVRNNQHLFLIQLFHYNISN